LNIAQRVTVVQAVNLICKDICKDAVHTARVNIFEELLESLSRIPGLEVFIGQLSFLRTGGGKLTTKTSAHLTRRSRISLEARDFKSSATPRLLRLERCQL
jgi:hypothetical protein